MKTEHHEENIHLIVLHLIRRREEFLVEVREERAQRRSPTTKRQHISVIIGKIHISYPKMYIQDIIFG